MYKYDDVYLEAARTIFAVESRLILNPRDVDNRSLLFVDSEWLTELTRYINEADYEVRVEKKLRGLT